MLAGTWSSDILSIETLIVVVSLVRGGRLVTGVGGPGIKTSASTMSLIGSDEKDHSRGCSSHAARLMQVAGASVTSITRLGTVLSSGLQCRGTAIYTKRRFIRRYKYNEVQCWTTVAHTSLTICWTKFASSPPLASNKNAENTSTTYLTT